MLETTPTTGSIESSDLKKRTLAKESLDYNLRDGLFCELFPDLEEKFRTIIATNIEETKVVASNGANFSNQIIPNANDATFRNPNNNNNNNFQLNENLESSYIYHGIFLLGLIAISFVVYNLNV
jgi:hypothetical protein